MAVFFVRFKAIDPNRGKPYFGNFEMAYNSVAEVVDALKANSPIVVKRYYAVHKGADRGVLQVERVEERTLSLEDVALVSLSRFTFDFMESNHEADLEEGHSSTSGPRPHAADQGAAADQENLPGPPPAHPAG